MIGHGGPQENLQPAASGLSDDQWWRLGWLVDADGSARWAPCRRPRHPLAAALAGRYNGEVVRVLRLPSRYGAQERLDDGVTIPVDDGHLGLEAVLSEGWPGGPPVPEGSVLIGPLDFLVDAQGREGPHQADDPDGAPAARPPSPPTWPAGRPRIDRLRVAAWTGAVLFSAAVWLGVALLIRALIG